MAERYVPTSPEMEQILEQAYKSEVIPLAPGQLRHRAGLLMDYLDSKEDVDHEDASDIQADKLSRDSRLDQE